ncbi:unnamed protein product, partial [Iphiclides podalirius]
MDRLSPINIIVKDAIIHQRAIPQLYKRLECFNHQRNNFIDKSGESSSVSELQEKYSEPPSEEKENVSQVVVFQDSMKIIYVTGQLLGLFPVTGLLKKEATMLRFSFLSWKYLYCLILCLPQLIITVLCFYSLITKRVSITRILFASFYASMSATCISFFRISSKWPALIVKLRNSRIDEYSDPNVILKCVAISVAFLGLCVVHIVSHVIERLATINECYPNSTDERTYHHLIGSVYVKIIIVLLISNGVSISRRLIGTSCSHYSIGPVNGYYHSVFYIIALLFVLLRLVLVSLCAAEVNTASLTTAPYLYTVPTTVFCSEVERFINQVQGDVVALSGLNFFNVTREFVLSVAGTIITYELVLLQLNGDLIGKF